MFQVIVLPSIWHTALKNIVLINPLKKQGISVKFATEGTKEDIEQECEILIGDITTRDEEYRTNGHSYGKDGYVIKLVDSKVIINAGSDAALVDAIEIFTDNDKIILQKYQR